jgi:hypothetical protein
VFCVSYNVMNMECGLRMRESTGSEHREETTRRYNMNNRITQVL